MDIAQFAEAVHITNHILSMENKTKTIFTVIEWAIKGGYRNRGTFYEKVGKSEDDVILDEIDFALTDYERPVLEEYFCNPKFFQAIGRASGWEADRDFTDKTEDTDWKQVALAFYELNLTEGMDSAIDYLYGLLPVNK